MELTAAAKLWCALLVEDFACELANQSSGSHHVTYASKHEALLAMAEQAYARGMAERPDFDRDVAAVAAANAANAAR